MAWANISGGADELLRSWRISDVTTPVPSMLRIVSVASTVARPGQSRSVAKQLASGQANTRRRTRRSYMSPNASKQGRRPASRLKACSANQPCTSLWTRP